MIGVLVVCAQGALDRPRVYVAADTARHSTAAACNAGVIHGRPPKAVKYAFTTHRACSCCDRVRISIAAGKTC